MQSWPLIMYWEWSLEKISTVVQLQAKCLTQNTKTRGEKVWGISYTEKNMSSFSFESI